MNDSLHADIITMIRHYGHGSAHCHLVLYAEYRLDLARQLADETGLVFRDFRREVLSEYGKQAHEQPLSLLDQAVIEQGDRAGAVIANAEALLATRPEQERRAWLAAIVDQPFAYPLLMPLALFGKETPPAHPRVIDLRERPLPEQSLINRLALSESMAN